MIFCSFTKIHIMENYSLDTIKKKLATLSIWKNNFSIEILDGGWTNETYLVSNDNKYYVAKIGDDKKDFGIIRSNELQAHKAASLAGISPKLLYSKKDISIYEYVNDKKLTLQDIREEKNLLKIVNLIKIIHKEVFKYLKLPNSFLNIFQMIDYKFHALIKCNSPYKDKLNDLMEDCKLFQNETNAYKIIFSHNDFYYKNILYDGKKFWLIDWEYSGFNPNILDLANLSRNSELNEDEDNFILEEYFGSQITSKLRNGFNKIKCISVLNEVMWWMLAEIKSKKNIDYKSITKEKMESYLIAKQKFFK